MSKLKFCVNRENNYYNKLIVNIMNIERKVDFVNYLSGIKICVKDHYVNKMTGIPASENDLQIAKNLGFDTDSLYVKRLCTVGNLYTNHALNVLQREEFDCLWKMLRIRMGENLDFTKQEKHIASSKIKYPFGVKIEKSIVPNTYVTFPNGDKIEITKKMASLSAIKDNIPAEYIIEIPYLSSIESYSLIFKGKTLTIGCKRLKKDDIYNYFNNIIKEWDKLNEELKLIQG